MLSYKFNIRFGQKKNWTICNVLIIMKIAGHLKKTLRGLISVYHFMSHFNFIQYGCFTIDNLLQFTTYPFEPKQFPF